MKEKGILKKFIGIYTLQGAYEKVPTAKISVIGNYNTYKLIFSNESFNENGLCLHRLHELDETFIDETPEKSLHRFNGSLSRLFYLREALQDPKIHPLVYNKSASDLGLTWFAKHMRSQGISAEICMDVLCQPAQTCLDKEFYKYTINFLKDEIYSLLGIDTDLLQSMYEGVGKTMIDYQYALKANPDL